MRRSVVPFLLGALCLGAPTAHAQQQKSRPRSRPATVLPMPPPPAAAKPAPAPEPAPTAEAPAPEVKAASARSEGSAQGEVGLQLAAEGFVGGLFPFSSAPAEVPPGVEGVDTGVPPVLRWGARLSSPFYRIDHTASLEWLATLALSHTGFEREFMGMTMSANVLGAELLPGLRLRFAVLPQLSLTGEVGIGVQFSRTATRMTFAGEETQGSAAGVFRFAFGGRYVVDERFSIFFEPVGVQAYVGQGSAAGWSLQAGFAYAL